MAIAIEKKNKKEEGGPQSLVEKNAGPAQSGYFEREGEGKGAPHLALCWTSDFLSPPPGVAHSISISWILAGASIPKLFIALSLPACLPALASL